MFMLYGFAWAKSMRRTKFSQEPLIFVVTSAGPQWRPVKDCIWTSDVYTEEMFRNRVAIGLVYHEHEDLFVRQFGVERVTSSMICDEIREKLLGMPSPPPIAGVKCLIRTINDLVNMEGMTAAGYDGKKLRILPLRSPSNALISEPKFEVGDSAADFIIDDRKDLKALGQKARWLDFTFEEVKELGPFIWWLGLDNKRVSSLVRRSVTVETDSEVTVLKSKDRSIARKAHALLRYVLSCCRPQISSLGCS